MNGPVYAAEDAALARVEVLKRSGHWPGVRRTGQGWVLLFDPEWVFR